MKEEILMPKMGESVMEGTLIKWNKKDETIFEISTDKVDTEVPSPRDGIITKILLKENETAEVGSVIAILETDAETVGDSKDETNQIIEEARKDNQVAEENLIDIPMPKMGESVMEGTILKWYKQVGESIKKDETLLEISTDKVDTEVPSPVSGTVTEILFKESETAEVESIIARISTSEKVAKISPDKNIDEPKIDENKKEAEPSTNRIKRDSTKSNKFYSPLVLNIARKESVSFEELERINGSGLNGRVSKKDILKYISERTSGTVKSEPKISYGSNVKSTERMEVIPMNNIRKRIMHHMIQSRDTSVHVSEMMEVDMTNIYNYIKNNRERLLREESIKMTYMPFICSAVVKGLKEFSLMNASVDGENILMKKYINLGIAVAVEPNGLIVPNIKNADEMSIRGLAKAVAEIGHKARNKGLLPDDVADGTFSITNYGVFGALFGNPIINQPEVGILGVGAVVKKPVVVEVNGADVIAIKPMMYLSLSHDHRLVDGMLGGKFLKMVKDTLENFDVNNI